MLRRSGHMSRAPSFTQGDAMKNPARSSGPSIPPLGLGTWKSHKGETFQAVSAAIEIGYRHIDCAPIYQNEKEVGEALARTLHSGQVTRDELWITSKLWNNAHAQKHVRPALERTLKDLQIDYLDLFLIHWPIHFQANVMFPRKPEEYVRFAEIPLEETWLAMEKLVKKGLCRHIGVCNFKASLLSRLCDAATIPPYMNQIELHPYLQQNHMLDFCNKRNILLTAYSPLGSGDRPAAMKKAGEPSLLEHPVISAIADKNQVTAAQVLLAWGIQRKTVVIPKSVNPVRLRENLAATEVRLDDAAIAQIEALECNYRYVDGSFFTGPKSPYSLADIWQE